MFTFHKKNVSFFFNFPLLFRDGSNVATSVAVNTVVESKNAHWADEKTMVNIINMIKNICGTSFGVILRHPRCSESNRGKISREFIDKYKQTFNSLSKLEKTNIATECQLYLKEFDTEVPRIDLEHLPSKPHKLEFNLVANLKTSEIMDYAIVAGDNPKHFTIRSLFNFKYQNVPDIRRITILLDTLASFLGNEKRVMDFKVLRDTFDMYARRTCQNLAVQELGILHVDTEGQPTELSATAIMADDTRFSIQSGKTEGLEQILNLPPSKVSRKTPGEVPSGRLPCTVDGCTDTFVDNRRLNAHIARMHASKGSDVDEEPRACVLCGKVLRNATELKRHMYYYHKETKCKHCGEEFTGNHFLQAHYNRYHTATLQCDVCGAECKGRSKLRIHKINKHMEEHQKPFVCSMCGKGFAEKMKLKSHQMNVHIRSRPFKCRIEGCSADFNELANRNSHEKTVHKYNYKKQVEDIQKSVQEASAVEETVQAVQYI